LILWHPTRETRAVVISKFIKVAEQLRNMNNFNTLIALVAGLNMASVARLKFSWQKVAPQAQELLKSYQELFNPSLSFSSYRKVQSSSRVPVLPYIGVSLSDLTFSEEGNQNFVGEGKDIINFAKREMISRIISDLLVYQKPPYPISISQPEYSFLTELPHFKDKELYELSLFREPRGSDISQIEQNEKDDERRSSL